MDTLAFYRAILPAQGWYYVAVMRQGQHGVSHIAFNTIEALAKATLELDKKPGLVVYHACGSYKDSHVTVGEKKKYRIQENTLAAKALWADLDVGADKAASEKGYPTKTDAAKAILQFCKDTGFPQPMLVDSGNGIHAYWLLADAVSAADWRTLATQLKAILAKFGVLADPTRTADFASILRPVGTYNRKDSSNPKPVKVLMGAKEIPVDAMMAAIANMVSNYDVEVLSAATDLLGAIPDYAKGSSEDLTAHIGPEIPCDANTMADHCQQIRFFRDTGGVEYQQWFQSIGTVKHCIDGEAIVHAWSAKAANYSRGETQQKLDSWSTGPSLCATFEKHNPVGCADCPSKGKVNTPLVLGRETPAPAPAAEVQILIDNKPVSIVVPELPQGFLFDGTQMIRMVKSKDGTLMARPFSFMLFYPIMRIVGADGNYHLMLRIHKPRKEILDFDVPSSLAATGGQGLQLHLGHAELSITTNKDAGEHMSAYMKASMHALIERAKHVATMITFGWQPRKNGFVFGDHLYNTDGSVNKVVLGGFALSKVVALPKPTGAAAGWAEGINAMYHHPEMQPMQYALCSAFGSILTPFGEDQYHGIPVALTGEKSGVGKTTVCRAALYGFGDAMSLQINGERGTTPNARWAVMGAMNNIPLLMDEITTIKVEDLTDMLYAASNGQAKVRMRSTSKGLVLDEAQTWNMSMYMTANTPLNDLLASGKLNSHALGVRFIEIKTDDYAIPKIDGEVVKAAELNIIKNAGSAGDLFIRWCVTHVPEIEQRMKDMGERIKLSAKAVQHSEYRYFRQHMVCTLVAAEIMQELELIAFDVPRLYKWAVEHITKLCEEVTIQNKVTPEDALSRALGDLAPDIITTRTYRNCNAGQQPESVARPRSTPIGRYIMGLSDGSEPQAGRLFLSKVALRDWCLQNRVALKPVLDVATQNGILVPDTQFKISLTRGTDISPVQAPCYVFDMDRMSDAMEGKPYLKLLKGSTASGRASQSAAAASEHSELSPGQSNG